jgi:predicted SAM-dependent methyltransferase
MLMANALLRALTRPGAVVRRAQNWASNRAKLQRCPSLTDVRVNIGCGGRPTPGWINLDLYYGADVIYWDCRKGLPFRDGAVSAIFAEHVFEHFEIEPDARAFLQECRRCLRPGGVLRLVVPDAGAYLKAYGDWNALARMRALRREDGRWIDPWLNDAYLTQMQLINAVFRQGQEHRYAYDEETLSLVLRQADFSQVVPQAYGKSLDPQMTADTPEREPESLYVEAVR